jgi:hypothetical protein
LAASTARFSPAQPNAHEGRPGASHNGFDVGEVDVDEARHRDELGNALYALSENFVDNGKSLEERSFFIYQLQEPIVMDGDDGVDFINQLVKSALRHLPALRALETEGFGNNRNGESTRLAG